MSTTQNEQEQNPQQKELAQQKAEFEIKQRQELAKLSPNELLERCVQQTYNNVNLANALLNTATELDRLGDVFAEYGVGCKRLANMITPKAPQTVEEQKKQENTQRNQQEGFQNRRERRNYELAKQKKIEALQKG